MRGYVANTDYDWWEYLASQPDLDEVNFWFPKYVGTFRAVAPGEPIFFKLKKPYYAIAGIIMTATWAVAPCLNCDDLVLACHSPLHAGKDTRTV